MFVGKRESGQQETVIDDVVVVQPLEGTMGVKIFHGVGDGFANCGRKSKKKNFNNCRQILTQRTFCLRIDLDAVH